MWKQRPPGGRQDDVHWGCGQEAESVAEHRTPQAHARTRQVLLPRGTFLVLMWWKGGSRKDRQKKKGTRGVRERGIEEVMGGSVREA